MNSRFACIALLALLLATTGFAQNNAGLSPPIYSTGDLVNTMSTPQVGPVAGTLGNSSVLLSSMPAAQSVLGQVTIAPCTTFGIHAHPRGNEQSMMLYGETPPSFVSFHISKLHRHLHLTRFLPPFFVYRHSANRLHL